jgi:hypothetical protein
MEAAAGKDALDPVVQPQPAERAGAALVEVDGELGGVQRLALVQVFAARHGSIPGCQGHMSYAPEPSGGRTRTPRA